MLQRARAVLLGQQTAEKQPVAMLGAARKAPAAAELVAAFDGHGLAGGHVGRCDPHAGILAPHILLGLRRKQRELPWVHADHAEHPGRGHAALGQFHLDGVEHARVHLVAAPALGLQHAEEPFARHLLDGFVTDAAFRIRLERALGQLGREGLGLLDHLQRFGGEIALRCEFVRHCVHLLGSPSPPFMRLWVDGVPVGCVPPVEMNALTATKGIHRPN